VHLPDRTPDEVEVADPRNGDGRDVRDLAGRPPVGVDLDEEVAGDAERQEIHGGAADDLIRAEMDRHERVHERERRAGDDAADDPPPPRPELVGAEEAEERPHEKHPLEADVHDPGALGEDASYRRERQRRRGAQRRRDQRGPDEDLLEPGDVRPRREDAERDPEHSRRDRADRQPPARTLPQREPSRHHAEPADDDGDDRRARGDGRKGNEERERAEADAAPAEPAAERLAVEPHPVERLGAYADAAALLPMPSLRPVLAQR
jgi:hypothetical protein